MPAYPKREMISFVGSKDGVPLKLPKFLFCDQPFVYKGLSPAACIDPAAAVCGRNAFASATAPSNELKKRILVIDKSFAPHEISFADNFAFVAKMRNAGFEVVMCCKKEGRKSFVKVTDEMNLYEEFFNLEIFDESAQSLDWEGLAEINVAKSESCFVDLEKKMDVLKCLAVMNVKKIEDVQETSSYLTLDDGFYNLYYRPYFEKSGFSDEICNVFIPRIDKASFERKLASLIKNYDERALKDLSCLCDKNQAKILLNNFIHKIDVADNLGLEIITNLAVAAPVFFTQSKAEIALLESLYKSDTQDKDHFGRRIRMISFKVAARVTKDKDKILSLIAACEENSVVKSFYNLAFYLQELPQYSSEIFSIYKREITFDDLFFLLKENYSLAKKVIESWPDGSKSAFDGNFLKIMRCLSAFPEVTQLLLKKISEVNKHLVVESVLRYLPPKEAEDILKKSYERGESRYRDAIGIVSKDFFAKMFEECEQSLTAEQIIATIEVFPERAQELLSLAKKRFSVSEKELNLALVKAVKKNPDILFLPEFSRLPIKEDFIEMLFATYLMQRPHDLPRLMSDPRFNSNKTKLLQAFCFSDYLIEQITSFPVYNIKSGVYDNKKRLQTLLHITDVENADINKLSEIDRSAIVVLRMVDGADAYKMSAIISILPNVKHVVLQSRTQEDPAIFAGLKEVWPSLSFEYLDCSNLRQKEESRKRKHSELSNDEDNSQEFVDEYDCKEELEGQGEIGDEGVLHDSEEAPPIKRKHDPKKSDDDYEEESILEKSFEQFFSVKEIGSQEELQAATIDGAMQKILIATSFVDDCANYFLRLAQGSQHFTKSADEQDFLAREIFYIDGPDKIDFDRLLLRINKGESLSFVAGDDLLLGASISAESLLMNFLQRAKYSRRPILMINWKKFDARQRLTLNTVLDLNRRIAGVEISPNIQIIGLVDEIPQDHSFISRHDLCVKSSAEIVNFAPTDFAPNAAPPISIDLQGFTNWRRHLFGRVVLVGERMEWQKSDFVKFIERGEKSFAMMNISDEDLQELQDEIKQAKARGFLNYHEYKIAIPPDFNLRFDFKAFDFKAFHKLDCKVAVSQTYQEIPPETCIINSCLFDLLLQDKIVDGRFYKESAGLIERHAGRKLSLFITSDLSESQWYCLFCQALEKNVALELYLSTGIKIPHNLKFREIEKSSAASSGAPFNGPKLIVANNSNEILKEFSKDILQQAVIIDVEDSSFQDLIFGITFDAITKESVKFCNFQNVAGAAFKALQLGKKVILKGKFAPDLMQFLHPYFVGNEEIFARNVMIIFEDENLLASSSKKDHEYLKWLPQGSYEVQYVQGHDKLDRAEIFAEAPASLQLDDKSAKASEEFIAKRKDKFAEMLKGTNMLQLVGHSGVGKSRLMKMFEEDASSPFEIHREMSSFKDWVSPSQQGKTKILFIDESNIEDQHFMLFAPLKAGGNKIISYKGEIFELGPHHKVVFAHNDKSYGGGRVEQKLFADKSIAEMHLADFPACYIYEKILKDSIYDKLSDDVKAKISLDEFKQYCQGLIANYYSHNASAPEEKSLTVRELQEEALQFLSSKFEENAQGEIKSANFISTDVTKDAEESLAIILKVRDLQRRRKFPNKAVGTNGILLKGSSGVGKSEMSGAILASLNIIEASKAKEGERCFYKIDATQSLEEKKAIIIKAFLEGAIIWIDELNGCIDDGLEKILNAVLTGSHPDTAEESTNAGFTLIASINSISMEGRSKISPALLHRLKLHEMKSLQEYSLDDFCKIIGHFLNVRNINIEQQHLVVKAIAEDFIKLLKSGKGRNFNLRDLNNLIEKDKELLKKYFTEITSPDPEKAKRILRRLGEKEPNFKEKAAAIDDFIENELPNLSAEKRAQINHRRLPKFLRHDREFVHYTLDASKIQGFDSRNKKAITAEDWNSEDPFNVNSYFALKEEILITPEYEKLFSFDDERKIISIKAPIETLLRVNKSVRKEILRLFPQFAVPLRQGNIYTIFGLKSRELLAKEAGDLSEMEDIAGHKTIFTKAELEQELFFRQENLKQKILPPANFEDLLSQSFCIGEFHHHGSSKRILVESMFSLKAQGYKTIFLEGIAYDGIVQYLLNEYFSAALKRLENPLAEILQDIDSADRNRECGYFKLVHTAKEHGLRSVGIDSQYSLNVPAAIKAGDNTVKRYKDMNYAAAAIIQTESQGKKWIAIMGNAHIKTCEKVAGVGEIMGVPSVYVYDSKIKREMTADFGVKKTKGIESEVRIACPKEAFLVLDIFHHDAMDVDATCAKPFCEDNLLPSPTVLQGREFSFTAKRARGRGD